MCCKCLLIRSDCFTHAFDLPLITLVHSLVVILFAKEEWEYALGDQVSAVDAGEGPGNDRANSEVQRRERGLFAAGALPVVVAADDDDAPLQGFGNRFALWRRNDVRTLQNLDGPCLF